MLDPLLLKLQPFLLHRRTARRIRVLLLDLSIEVIKPIFVVCFVQPR
ncbi:MAG: hypothetical protein J2P48_01250 [Alphaproteobacteria bacterium]|nr:hypothetical protein [Alphaproteobacteria bacterium]